jgi:hypothetical protein
MTAGLSLLLLTLCAVTTAWADCNVGPTFCPDTPSYQTALAQKKKSLLKDNPARLVAILDRADHCEACITRGPDGFSLLIQDTSGKILIDGWDADNERIGANDLAAGKIKACRVIWAREAFDCTLHNKAQQRPDWDSALEYSASMSVPCSTTP